MMRRLLFWPAMAIGLVISAACERPAAVSTAPAAAATGSDAGAVGDPVSEEEAAEFADAVVAAIYDGDANEYHRRLDFDGLLERMWGDMSVPAKLRQEFDQGLRSSMIEQHQFFNEIRRQVVEGGSYKLLRVRTRDGRRTALFRMFMPDTGINYHEFRLVRKADGAIRSDDWYIASSGEWMSETMRRFSLAIVADADRNWIDRLTGKQQEVIKHLPRIAQVTASFQQRDPGGALQILNGLPETLQVEKFVLLLRLRAAMEADDDDAYLAALSDFRRHHPDDPAWTLQSVDYFIMTEEFAEAEASVDKLEEFLGGDPYCEVLRAGIHMEKGDLDAASEAGRRALAADPEMEEAYWVMINVENARKNFDEVARWIRVLAERTELDPDDFALAPDFEEFAASPAFDAWRVEVAGGS